MFKFIKNWFKPKEKENITLQNWDFLDYQGVVYNILQTGDNFWKVEVFLFMTEKDIENQFALSLPLDMLFEDYISAFKHIQEIGPIFRNTIADVVVVNFDGKPFETLSLNNLPPKASFLSKREGKLIHNGTKTIN